MRKTLWILGFSVLIGLNSCELTDDLNLDSDELSDSEIVEGLKKALEVGTDSAANVLGLENGYFGNPLLKIPLPEDVQNVRNLINGNSTVRLIADGLQINKKFDDVILAVNRAAEDAASDAAPIFKSAISDLTLADGWDILNGVVPGSELKSTKAGDFDSTAATTYFMNTTYDPLVDLFSPQINSALDRPVSALGFSAVVAWNTLTSTYNSLLSNTTVQLAISFGQINLPAELNTDLGGFCTAKALDGLFLKVGEEEKKIRRNPFEWAVNIIQRVFGYVFQDS